MLMAGGEGIVPIPPVVKNDTVPEGVLDTVNAAVGNLFPTGIPVGAEIWLFGSVARGTQSEQSDTDVAVFLPDRDGYEVLAEDENSVELHLVGRDRSRDPKCNAVLGVALDGICLNLGV